MAEHEKRDKPKRGRHHDNAKKYKAIGRRKLAEMIRAHRISDPRETKR